MAGILEFRKRGDSAVCPMEASEGEARKNNGRVYGKGKSWEK
jgi:hypothetical protein